MSWKTQAANALSAAETLWGGGKRDEAWERLYDADQLLQQAQTRTEEQPDVGRKQDVLVESLHARVKFLFRSERNKREAISRENQDLYEIENNQFNDETSFKKTYDENQKTEKKKQEAIKDLKKKKTNVSTAEIEALELRYDNEKKSFVTNLDMWSKYFTVLYSSTVTGASKPATESIWYKVYDTIDSTNFRIVIPSNRTQMLSENAKAKITQRFWQMLEHDSVLVDHFLENFHEPMDAFKYKTAVDEMFTVEFESWRKSNTVVNAAATRKAVEFMRNWLNNDNDTLVTPAKMHTELMSVFYNLEIEYNSKHSLRKASKCFQSVYSETDKLPKLDDTYRRAYLAHMKRMYVKFCVCFNRWNMDVFMAQLLVFYGDPKESSVLAEEIQRDRDYLRGASFFHYDRVGVQKTTETTFYKDETGFDSLLDNKAAVVEKLDTYQDLSADPNERRKRVLTTSEQLIKGMKTKQQQQQTAANTPPLHLTRTTKQNVMVPAAADANRVYHQRVVKDGKDKAANVNMVKIDFAERAKPFDAPRGQVSVTRSKGNVDGSTSRWDPVDTSSSTKSLNTSYGAGGVQVIPPGPSMFRAPSTMRLPPTKSRTQSVQPPPALPNKLKKSPTAKQPTVVRVKLNPASIARVNQYLTAKGCDQPFQDMQPCLQVKVVCAMMHLRCAPKDVDLLCKTFDNKTDELMKG